MTTELSLKIDSKEFGEKVVQTAIERTKQAHLDRIIGFAQHLIDMRFQCEQTIAKIQINIDMYTKKLEAIETGAFTVSPAGEIKFNDPTLNF